MNKMDHKPRLLGLFLLCLLAIFLLSSCEVASTPEAATDDDEIIVAKVEAVEDKREPEDPETDIEDTEDTKTRAEDEDHEEIEEDIEEIEEDIEEIEKETEETDNDVKPEEEITVENQKQEETKEEAEPQPNGFSKSEITDEIKQRITGLSYSADCTVPYDDLRYLRVMSVDFGGSDRVGEIVCNKAIADDLLEIFKGLYDARYEIDKIRLIDEYGADDDLSCADDNTSCFCFRKVYGSKNLSKHALGMAIDINPFYNPYVTYPDGKIRISPPGSEPYADRSADFPHKIDKNDLAYKLFKAHGFKWGGDWNSLKDYQHFQKG